MRSALDTKMYKEYIQRSQEGFDASLQVFASHLWHDAEGHVSRSLAGGLCLSNLWSPLSLCTLRPCFVAARVRLLASVAAFWCGCLFGLPLWLCF